MATAFFAGAFTSHQLEPHRFLKRGQLPGSCTPSSPIAQKTRDNSGTSPSNLLLRLRAKWQQRPETPALIRRIHTSSSHHTPHQCSDSAEEWIRAFPCRFLNSKSPWQSRQAVGAKNTQIPCPTHTASQLISRAYRSDQKCSHRRPCQLRKLPLHCLCRVNRPFLLPPGFVPQAVFRSHDHHPPAALRRFQLAGLL